jgi:anti-anti-sigma factor
VESQPQSGYIHALTGSAQARILGSVSMQLVEQHADNVTILEVTGNIDSDSAKELTSELTSLIQRGRTRLIIELRNAAYMTSSGVRALCIAFES